MAVRRNGGEYRRYAHGLRRSKIPMPVQRNGGKYRRYAHGGGLEDIRETRGRHAGDTRETRGRQAGGRRRTLGRHAEDNWTTCRRHVEGSKAVARQTRQTLGRKGQEGGWGRRAEVVRRRRGLFAGSSGPAGSGISSERSGFAGAPKSTPGREYLQRGGRAGPLFDPFWHISRGPKVPHMRVVRARLECIF